MSQTVTTIDQLMPHLAGVTTARELGARVIALVPSLPRGIRQRLAFEARQQLAKSWSDSTVKTWLSPSSHTEERKKQNREAVRKAAKLWNERNRDRALAANAKWNAENVARHREGSRRWREANRQKIKSDKRKRLTTDPVFRLGERLRTRLWHALRGNNKSASTMELVGCDVGALVGHLELQFVEGMTWHNYGTWHVDHIRPCASFDLTDPAEQRACFHFSNLRPMWAGDNLSKGSLHGGVRHRQALPR